MIGTIGFEDLQVTCIIGVKPHERIVSQEIFVDLKMELDLAKCVATDDVADTIDYEKAANMCQNIAEAGQYHLLESYIHAVNEALAQEFAVKSIWIKVKKSAALPSAKYATAELRKNFS